MLLQRSIFHEVCLVLIVCLVKAQHGYDVEENSEGADEAEHPDYAQYYSGDTSAPLVSAQEGPNQAEFENFFGPLSPIVYGESSKKAVKVPSVTFVPEEKKQRKEPLQTFETKKEEFPAYPYPTGPLKEFFEESEKILQQEQSREDEVIRPGPSYVSYQIPASHEEGEHDEDKSATDEDAERVPSRANNPKKDTYDHGLSEEGRVEKDDDDYTVPDVNSHSAHFKNSKPPVDYNVGKSSSTVSQYSPRTKNNNGAASSPYEKYDYQPEKEASASSPYEKYSSKPEKKGVDSSPYGNYAAQFEKEASASAPHGKYSSKPEKKGAESSLYEKYGYQPEKEASASSPYEKYSAKPEKKSGASSPYEKYGYQPEKEGAASSPFEKYTSKPEKKGAAGSPYEKYGYQPEKEGAASSPYEKYSFNPEKKDATGSPYEKYGYQPEKEGAASSPYEKYSFNPEKEGYDGQDVRFFDNPKFSKIAQANYEAQSSEDVPSPLKGEGCRKVASNSDDMNCFVCENAKTNGKYTQCSYSSQKEPVNRYEGNSAKYSLPQKEASSYRYKRNAENRETDPYTYIRNRAQKASEEPGIPSDYGSGFNYEPYHYDESKPEFTYSEQNSEEIKKNPENCKKVDRKGMTCTVCKDPKTGGNFEQCSYTSEPKEKKYAYVTEKKYENDEPVESQIVPQVKTVELAGESKAVTESTKAAEAVEDFEGRTTPDKSPKKRNEESREESHDRNREESRERSREESRERSREDTQEDFDAKPSEKKSVDEVYNYEVPSHFIKSLSAPSHTKSDSSSESAENIEKQKEADYSEFDEYHFKLFPEFAKQESKREDVTESYQIPEATKQNVETVLAEFSKKDRSKCKKAEKKGMTCYLCVDQNNIQHEECMYVQESRPQSSHVAYHEVKAVKEPEKIKAEESRIEPVYAESKRKHFFKKVTTPTPLNLEQSPSEEVDSVIRYNQEQINIKKKRSNNEKPSPKKKSKSSEEILDDSERLDDSPSASTFDDSERIDDKADPTIKTPAEFNVAEGEGAFSDETRPVYSKVLGVKLPKYMLEKSEFEKEFDDFAGSF